MKAQSRNDNYMAKGFSNLNVNGVPTVHVMATDKSKPNKVGEGSSKSLSKMTKDIKNIEK